MRLGFGETSQLYFIGLGTVGADLLEPDFWPALTSGLRVIRPDPKPASPGRERLSPVLAS
jgi:hypothetical protein